MAVLFIMGAGYIINDIFDIKTDTINKKNNLVSKHISIEKAKRLYLVLNTIGISLGVFLCLNTGKPSLSFIFFATPLLLYYYSKKWKAKPLIGNIIVSFLVAFSTVILIIFDTDFSTVSEEIKLTILLFAIFAFTLNLIREICKDIEDIKGDYSLNMNTLPILIGRDRSKKLALILIALLAIGIALIILILAPIHKLASLYLVTIVLSSVVYSLFQLKKASSKKDFHRINTFLKICMFLGINSIIILSINNNVL
jgi:4-hydroxybenzoate polyprenyltransferase